VFDKLGRPADAAKYEFAKVPDGMKLDEGYQNWARGTFHKIGLLPGQVKELSAAHNEYMKGVLAKQDEDYNLSVTSDKKALQAEWKDGTERMLGLAKAAAQGLGFTPEMIDGMERAAGYATVHKVFAEIGKRLGEDSFVSGGGKPRLDGLMTPQEAKAQWDKLSLDKDFVAILGNPMHPKYAEHQKKQTDLFKIMYPEK
jgi:hypothetical protein